LVKAGTLALEHGPYRVMGWSVAAVYPLVRWFAGMALQAWIRAQAAAAEGEEPVDGGAAGSESEVAVKRAT